MNFVHAAISAAGDDQQKAAPLGLFVLLLLGVACYFLFKSMSRHLKRVREEFPLGSSTAPTTASTVTRPAPTARPAGSASTLRPAGDGSGPAQPESSAADSVDSADDGEHLRPH